MMVAELMERVHHTDSNSISSSSSPKECHFSNGLMHRPSSSLSSSSPPPFDGKPRSASKDPFSSRKQREFIPDAKKDDSYWDRRRRNNEAAKRSREKRRFNDLILERRVIELTKENHVLRAQLDAIRDKYNICGEGLVSVDQIMATLPTSEQVLSITKRLKSNQRYDTPMEEDKEWKAYERSQAPPTLSPAHLMEDEHLYAFKPIQPQLDQMHAPPQFTAPPPEPLDAPPPTFFPSGAALNLSRRSACSDDEEAAAPQLPLKLRHKGHYGQAAPLDGIKREKEKVAASPPWDGDSDERDSGICVNWAAAALPENRGGAGQLKSQLARLEEEIVTIKHMMILSGGGGATAAAQ